LHNQGLAQGTEVAPFQTSEQAPELKGGKKLDGNSVIQTHEVTIY